MLGNITAGGEIIGNLAGGERRYFLKDHLGSVRTTVDRNGNIVGRDDYYPFGLAMPWRSSNSSNPNDDYKFTGYELDDEAGLTVYHAGARGYDPVLGRFMQIDPKHDHPALIGLSPYNYALNNPMKYNDPDGECPPIICGAIGGAALDYAIQVGTNLAQGKDLDDALTDIDGKSLLVSAGAGAVGAGVVSKSGKLLNLVRGSAKVDDVVNVADDAAKAVNNPYLKKSASELNKSKNSFEKLIKEHTKKLDDFKANPDKFDNKGLLKSASPENRKKIIEGRIKSLQKQIKRQQDELDKVNDVIKNQN